MGLKSKAFLSACLILTSILFGSCVYRQDQTVSLQISPSIESTFTQAPATATLTFIPTSILTTTETPLPTATGTFAYPLPTLSPGCGTVKLGRAGTQTIDHSENMLIQGTAILCGQVYLEGPFLNPLPVLESMIDLDIGKFDLKSADIQFCPGGGTDIFYYFCNVNGALVKEFSLLPQDPEQPTFEDCQNVTKPYSRTTDNEPKYACVITNSGNISRIKIEQYNPLDNEMSLEISFITWEK